MFDFKELKNLIENFLLCKYNLTNFSGMKISFDKFNVKIEIRAYDRRLEREQRRYIPMLITDTMLNDFVNEGQE